MFLTAYNLGAQSEERILQYDVIIEVDKYRSIRVTEQIRVQAAEKRIKRGIYRSLPIEREYADGRIRSMQYDFVKVLRDGQTEPYHIKKHKDGGKVLYIGQQDKLLPKGEYQYTLVYDLPEQVELLDSIDEIYWNAIGHFWDFPIEQASCVVILPEGSTAQHMACYTGPYGSTAQDCDYQASGNKVRFELTKPVEPKEGMTVAVGFPKGLVEPPPIWQLYRIPALLGAVLLGMLFYFWRSWRKYGIDPPRPTPYPLFDAPSGLSPAAINYITNERYKQVSFTASLIQLAVKGFIWIDEEPHYGPYPQYTFLQMKPPNESLPPEEQGLMEVFFAEEPGKTIIHDAYDPILWKAINRHRVKLKRQYETLLKRGDNQNKIYLPVLVSAVAAASAAAFLQYSGRGGTPFIWDIIALLTFLVAAPLCIIVYSYLIKRPSKAKLKLQSEIEGFKTYLMMAEKDRLRLLHPPERSPAHFEAMLPYALALGVAHEWSEGFKNALLQAAYQPDWSNKSDFHHDTERFTDDINTSIEKSSDKSPPSTNRGRKRSGSSGSGGSRGGGFSGGGGGGGGGGGW